MQISCATTIIYLNNGIFYVGSHYGDCQLARLSPVALRGLDGKLSHVQILDVYKNVAPISDAVITESEGSTQARIIILGPWKCDTDPNLLFSGHYLFRRVQQWLVEGM